jgi:hypothetical protein
MRPPAKPRAAAAVLGITDPIGDARGTRRRHRDPDPREIGERFSYMPNASGSGAARTGRREAFDYRRPHKPELQFKAKRFMRWRKKIAATGCFFGIVWRMTGSDGLSAY